VDPGPLLGEERECNRFGEWTLVGSARRRVANVSRPTWRSPKINKSVVGLEKSAVRCLREHAMEIVSGGMSRVFRSLSLSITVC